MKNIGSNRERRGRHDYWGCYHDRDIELGELAEKESHEIGTCRGLPMCQYCQEEKENDEKSSCDG